MMLFTDTITGTAAESECSDHNGWLVILDSDESALWMKTLRNNNEGLWHDIHSIQCTCYRNTDSEFQYILLPEDGHKIANIILKKGYTWQYNSAFLGLLQPESDAIMSSFIVVKLHLSLSFNFKRYKCNIDDFHNK